MQTEKPKRAFNVSTTAMITGITAITDAAIEHAEALSALDTRFSRDYFQELRGRIDTGSRRIGSDNAVGMRTATDIVDARLDEAQTELRLVKLWIEARFGDDPVYRDELLTTLGFTSLYRNVSRGLQSDTRALLLRFSENLTPGLTQKFTTLGMPAGRMLRIRELSSEFAVADSGQERQKKKRGELTETDVRLFNGLYAEVMSIAKMAQALFEDRPAIKAGFVFGKTAPASRKSAGR